MRLLSWIANVPDWFDPANKWRNLFLTIVFFSTIIIGPAAWTVTGSLESAAKLTALIGIPATALLFLGTLFAAFGKAAEKAATRLGDVGMPLVERDRAELKQNVTDCAGAFRWLTACVVYALLQTGFSLIWTSRASTIEPPRAKPSRLSFVVRDSTAQRTALLSDHRWAAGLLEQLMAEEKSAAGKAMFTHFVTKERDTPTESLRCTLRLTDEYAGKLAIVGYVFVVRSAGSRYVFEPVRLEAVPGAAGGFACPRLDTGDSLWFFVKLVSAASPPSFPNSLQSALTIHAE